MGHVLATFARERGLVEFEGDRGTMLPVRTFDQDVNLVDGAAEIG